MIDYVFALVVGLLAAAAAGYAYRAAKSAEELLKKIKEWEEAWSAYYAAMQSGAQQAAEAAEASATKEVEKAEAAEGEDYVSQLMKKISCAGELMKSRGGCAPIDEVMSKCGLAKLALRSLFNIKENKGEVCLRT